MKLSLCADSSDLRVITPQCDAFLDEEDRWDITRHSGQTKVNSVEYLKYFNRAILLLAILKKKKK